MVKMTAKTQSTPAAKCGRRGIIHARAIRPDGRAQAAIYDALLFFVLMSIASSIIFVQYQYVYGDTGIDRRYSIKYAHEAKDVILSSTIKEAWCIRIGMDDFGNVRPMTYNLSGKTVLALIMEETSMVSFAAVRGFFIAGVEEKINATARSVIEANYNYALTYSCGYAGSSPYPITLSSAAFEPTTERYTSTDRIELGNGKTLDISLVIW